MSRAFCLLIAILFEFQTFAMSNIYSSEEEEFNNVADNVASFRVFERRIYLDENCQKNWTHTNTIAFLSSCWIDQRTKDSIVAMGIGRSYQKLKAIRTRRGREVHLKLYAHWTSLVVQATAADNQPISYNEIKQNIESLFLKDNSGRLYVPVQYMQSKDYRSGSDQIVDRVALVERTYQKAFNLDKCQNRWIKNIWYYRCTQIYSGAANRIAFMSFGIVPDKYTDELDASIRFYGNGVELSFDFDERENESFEKAYARGVGALINIEQKWIAGGVNKYRFIVPQSEVGQGMPDGVIEK